MNTRFLTMLLVGAGLFFSTRPKSTMWKSQPNAEKYLVLLANAERRFGLPTDLLARMAYQESHWRNDIVFGFTKSSAGGVGLMQIVPQWHPNVDPLNVPVAINYAAQYLQGLYNQFKSWKLAVAAYNAGQGNVKKYGGIPPFPETQKYVSEVFADIPSIYT